MQQNPHFLVIAYLCDHPQGKMDKVELERFPLITYGYSVKKYDLNVQ